MEKKKIYRVCGTPSRGGCITCKARHVKCDETKPKCLKCLNARKPGRTCEGYADSINESNTITTKVSMKSARLSNPKQSPSQDLGLLPTVSQDDKRVFHSFVTRSAACLAGHFSSTFWKTRVLQLSISEPCVRHAVVAIGGIHEQFSKGQLLFRENSQTIPSLFTLRHHAKAIKDLGDLLATSEQWDLTLTACILFVCFESFLGNHKASLVHLRAGLKILKDIDNSGTTLAKAWKEEFSPILMRLGISTCIFLDPRQDKHRAALWDDLQIAVPSNPSIPFQSIEDAHWSLSAIGAGMICDRGESRKPPTESLKERHMGLLSTWEEKLRVFLSQADKFDPAIAATLRGAALLKIFYILVSITGELHERSEVLFSEMVDLCGTVDMAKLVNGDRLAPLTIFNFTSDLGTIAPLFFVALKSQSPVTRLRAWRLMKRQPRKEGLWDSEMCADVAEKVMGGFDGPVIEDGMDVMGRYEGFVEEELPRSMQRHPKNAFWVT